MRKDVKTMPGTESILDKMGIDLENEDPFIFEEADEEVTFTFEELKQLIGDGVVHEED